MLIRSFVRDIAGIDAPRMTLAELNRQGIPAAASAISSLYPAEFSPEPRDTEPRDSVAAAAETARRGGPDMELIFWWMIPAALLIAVGTYWVARKRDRSHGSLRRPVAHSHRLTELPEYQAALRRHRRWLTVAAVAGGVLMAAAVVSAARPAERSTVSPEQRNRDIILCLDASGSMSSADAAVVEVFARLAQGFDGERLGLTVFDSSAVQVFPLTDDYDFVQEQLRVPRKRSTGHPEAPVSWTAPGTAPGPR